MGERSEKSRQSGPDRSEPDKERDWADEAARARTADDPRARAPRDATGTPSTGDR
ncbi:MULTISPECIES: hypothetical protein [Micromonospora]|uniref:Uncharacterized protein n=1 Tax=Micromonospora yangpuensis TaxID=683228 RepID=A0A1C6U0R9_9ACTN|nr:hypothetical protein [Micromonospora yangpuensis]GGM11389.1 hypothetical protein GCM10012279_31860 [Micromonospora yangpuensis]SCL47690.1 hypothetical protein GA0070617_0659 [Micromonospora yangpuensis]